MLPLLTACRNFTSIIMHIITALLAALMLACSSSAFAAIQFTDEQIEDYVSAYQIRYARTNHAIGKSFTDFTSADIAKLDSPRLQALRNMMTLEKFHITDRLLPNNMDRTEFTRSILRELARRSEVAFPFNLFPTGDPALQNTQATVTRFPFAVDNAQSEQVAQSVGSMVMRDGFVDIMQTNASGIRLSSDVGAPVGLKGLTYPIATDTEAFTFGYAVGAQPQFQKNDALKLTLTLAPNREQSELISAQRDEMEKRGTPKPELDALERREANKFVQSNHCADIAAIFEAGRALNNNEAVARGFIQARVDARSEFSPIVNGQPKDRLGIYADCPSKKAQAR